MGCAARPGAASRPPVVRSGGARSIAGLCAGGARENVGVCEGVRSGGSERLCLSPRGARGAAAASPVPRSENPRRESCGPPEAGKSSRSLSRLLRGTFPSAGAPGPRGGCEGLRDGGGCVTQRRGAGAAPGLREPRRVRSRAAVLRAAPAWSSARLLFIALHGRVLVWGWVLSHAALLVAGLNAILSRPLGSLSLRVFECCIFL